MHGRWRDGHASRALGGGLGVDSYPYSEASAAGPGFGTGVGWKKQGRVRGKGNIGNSVGERRLESLQLERVV
jgi:hypothetical protein